MKRADAHTYVAMYTAALVVAVVLSIRYRRRIALFQSSYWRWLLVPWKLVTFAISAHVMVAAAPFMGDCDWDPPVSVLMAAFTFVTAPWVVGELWRRRSIVGAYVAVCAWLLSASWSFDLYWFMRRGYYPGSWLGNLAASSMLYFAAGLLWNLSWTERSGWHFACRESGWPQSSPTAPWRKIALPAVAIMTVVGTSLLLPFVWAPR